jgi:hypothetical protein
VSPATKSGQAPFVFEHRPDLSHLPAAAREFEVKLHGGFAVDPRPDFGQIYYGMPGCGIMRVDADLDGQSILELPAGLQPENFHSTKIGQFDGQWRLILSANDSEKVIVLTLDGKVDFVLPRPEFEQYQSPETPYRPTDTVLVDRQLFVADGYGSNYILWADVGTRQWAGIFGGRTEDPTEDGKFLTAHGLNFNPVHHHLDIADRPHSRVQNHGLDGHFIASHKYPQGAYLCGINYVNYQGRWLAVIGCLRDPEPERRPAPIYILDASTYELLSTIRPKEELGIELAQHIHNTVFHVHDGQLYLIVQAWNPGHYFVLAKV